MIRRQQLSFFMAVSLLVVGCQPVASSPGGGSAGSTGGRSEASAGPDGSPTTPTGPFPSLITLELDAGGPFITPDDGPENAAYALPAAAARSRDGGYVLFIVWFGTEGLDRVWITVSTSGDGETWDVGTEAIITDLGVGNPDPGPIPSAALQLEDGSWLLYGWAADASNPNYFASWRASAPDVHGPWTLDEPRVLAPGLPGMWDSQFAAIAAVRPTDAAYAAWYEGQSPGSEARGDVGYATSADGLAWTKFSDPASTSLERAESDPVLARGICGEDTQQAIFQPQVEPAGDGLLAVFGGLRGRRETMNLFGAVSDDGVAWRCGTPASILRTEDIPGSEGIHSIASLPLDDGRVMLIIESLAGEHSELWRATVELAARNLGPMNGIGGIGGRALAARLGRVGVWSFALQRLTAADEAAAMRELERLGFPTVWYPESLGSKEAFAHGAILLGGTERAVVGPGIASIYARDPMAMATGAKALGEAYPGRFVLGIGVSHAPSVSMRGGAYGKPVETMRAYLDGMDAATYAGPEPSEPVPLVLAALGPRMLELAAERADGAHPYFVPVEHTPIARGALGPEPCLVVEQTAVLSTDPEAARRIGRAFARHYLALPNYANNLRRLGWSDDDITNDGSDRLIDAVVAWGDVNAIVDRVRAHLDAGADHVCVQLRAESSADPSLGGYAELAESLLAL